MEFVLAFQQPIEVYENYADPEKGKESSRAWGEYMNSMALAGVMRGGKQINAVNAVSVQVRDGKTEAHQGPASNTGTLLGGYVVIDVANIEEAMKWASRSPSASTGTTEVWPVLNIQRSSSK